MRLHQHLVPAVLALCACAWSPAVESSAAPPAASVAPDVSPPVARVNGEVITEAELARGVPKGLFGKNRLWTRQARLNELLDIAALRQELATRRASGDPAAIERDFAETVKSPPPQSCGCAYADFDDYLTQNYLTADDVRAQLAIERGLRAAAQAAWDKVCPDEAAKAALVAQAGPGLRAKYCRFWRIPFVLGPGERNDDPAHRGPTWDKALAAAQRIRGGAAFAAVAKEVGVDPEALDDSGAAGVMSVDNAAIFGLDEAAFAALPPGQASLPLRGYMGYQVTRWEPLSDADVLDTLRKESDERVRAEVHAIADRRKVEYVGAGAQLAPHAE